MPKGFFYYYYTQLKKSVLCWTSNQLFASGSLHKVNLLTAGRRVSFNFGHSLTNRGTHVIPWEIRLESEWEETNPEEGSASMLSLCCTQHDEIWMASSVTNAFWMTIKHRSYNLLISFSIEKHNKQCSAHYLTDGLAFKIMKKKLIFTAPTPCIWGSILKLLSILL